MQQGKFRLLSCCKIAEDVYELVLRGDCAAITAPGQFVNIQLQNFFLRRPISVCDVNGDRLTLICKAIGGGTRALCSALPGTEFDVLSGLGNGFSTERSGLQPLLCGGGVGTPPLYLLAKRLLQQGIVPLVALGFSSQKDVFYVEQFKALGCAVEVATMDGSYGMPGMVTDVIRERFPQADYVYVCGPVPMLRAIYDLSLPGQFSFEERMGCGFGACMGCTCKTKNGAKRICKEGPVLYREEIIW